MNHKSLTELLEDVGYALIQPLSRGILGDRYLVRTAKGLRLCADVIAGDKVGTDSAVWEKVAKASAGARYSWRIVRSLSHSLLEDGSVVVTTDLDACAVPLSQITSSYMGELEIWHLFRQMLDCVADLHDSGLTHGAINLGSFYLEGSAVRLSDLWVNEHKSQGNFAPALADDVYALGLCLRELVLGRRSGNDRPTSISSEHRLLCSRRPELTFSIHGVMTATLNGDPAKRPSVQELRSFVDDAIRGLAQDRTSAMVMTPRIAPAYCLR